MMGDSRVTDGRLGHLVFLDGILVVRKRPSPEPGVKFVSIYPLGLIQIEIEQKYDLL